MKQPTQKEMEVIQRHARPIIAAMSAHISVNIIMVLGIGYLVGNLIIYLLT